MTSNTEKLTHHELTAEWVDDSQGRAIMLTQRADNYDEPGDNGKGAGENADGVAAKLTCGPGNVFRGQINEANQRAFYQRWHDLMQAGRWSEVPQRDEPTLKEAA